MWCKKAKTITCLRGQLNDLSRRHEQLKRTRFRISIPTQMGIRPLWDVDMEYAILLTNMMGGQGKNIEGLNVEVITDYTPELTWDEGDREYDRPFD